MRVAIILDMEGASGIEHFRELYPIYPEYWQTGRQKLTNDIAAAALGLRDGGATTIAVMNHHGAGETGWPNVIVDGLPSGVDYEPDLDKRDLRGRVDAIFQVGCHARGGSPSFSSHTILPGLRLRLDGELMSESHWWALAAATPVLGIVGSAALGANLGFLADVPFLPVQGGEGRARPVPLYRGGDASAGAIRSFAHSAIRDLPSRGPAGRRAFEPRDFVLEASLQNGDDAAEALEAAGWSRTTRTDFRLESETWRGPGERVEEAIGAAIEAAWEPYSFAFADLDPTTEATSQAYSPTAFAADDALLHAWHAHPMVEWYTPESAARWEGLDTGQA